MRSFYKCFLAVGLCVLLMFSDLNPLLLCESYKNFVNSFISSYPTLVSVFFFSLLAVLWFASEKLKKVD